MAAVRHLQFSKFGILVMWPVSNLFLLLRAKFRVNRTINCWDIPKNDFQYGGRPPYWICKILIFCDVAVIGTKICICTKNFVEIGLFSAEIERKKTFSKWRPSAVLNFRNLVFWSCDLCLTWSCFFMPNFALIGHDSRLSYSDKSIFKMAADRHREFSKFDILVMWPVLERDSVLS